VLFRHVAAAAHAGDRQHRTTVSII